MLIDTVISILAGSTKLFLLKTATTAGTERKEEERVGKIDNLLALLRGFCSATSGKTHAGPQVHL
jgi:hypothetical protein